MGTGMSCRASSGRTPGRLALTLGVVALLAACSASTSDDVSASGDAAPSEQSAAAPAESPAEDHQRRDCNSSIASFPATESGDPDAEALRFLAMDDVAMIGAEELVPDSNGELTIHKAVAQVSDSADGPVTVSIDPADRDVARLSYDPAVGGNIPLEEGVSVVVFEPCDGLLTQYNGGFVVNGPRCVHLTISSGDPGDTIERSYAFGINSCG